MKKLVLLVAVLMLCSVGGCTPSPSTPAAKDHSEHDHDHDHAEASSSKTFPEAVEAVAKMSSSILDAFEREMPEDAHDALHDIGHAMECLPELGKKAGLSDEANAQVSGATERLMNAFEALDATLHGGEGKGLDEVKAEIESSLSTLRSVLP